MCFFEWSEIMNLVLIAQKKLTRHVLLVVKEVENDFTVRYDIGTEFGILGDLFRNHRFFSYLSSKPDFRKTFSHVGRPLGLLQAFYGEVGSNGFFFDALSIAIWLFFCCFFDSLRVMRYLYCSENVRDGSANLTRFTVEIVLVA